MRKFQFTIFIILTYVIVYAQSPGYITLKGRQFYDKTGTPFFPMVMNYHVNIVHDQVNNPQYKVIRSTDYGTQKCVLEGGYSFADCENSLRDDFTRLSQMGFNTVRLVGDLTPFRNGNGVLGFTKWSGIYNFGTGPGTFCTAPRLYFHLNPPYTNSTCATYFNLIARFLDIADQYNMKVILLVTDASGCITYGNGTVICSPDRGSSLTDAQDYASYLTELAKVLKNKTALLAYDLYNEPLWEANSNNGRNMDKDKQTVCEYVSLWYDAIKAEDQHHLITLGGSDFNDVLYWDTGVMKIDFVSVHMYPGPDEDGLFPANSPVRREDIINQFHWFTEALGKPWIIGETGFSASDESCLNNVVWGNEAAQSDYMSDILPAVRDCNGSGFSWWLFQDINWYCFSNNLCNPTCTVCSFCASTNNNKELKEDFFGIQKYGDPDPLTGLYSGSDLKSAAQVSIDFNEGNGIPTIAPCDAPTPFYYDPSQFSTLNTNTSSYLTGRIEDQDGNAINNAVILALNWLYTFDPDPNIPNNEVYHHIWIHTFSNNNTSGNNFTIIPYTPFNPNDGRIICIKVSTTGGSRTALGDTWPYEDVAMNTNVGTIVLNKVKFDYDTELENTTISTSSFQKNYRGWNSLKVSNSTINNGVTSELVARNEININPSFSAELGSDVHIYLDETFADCGDYTGFLRKINPDPENNHEVDTSNYKQIKLVFQKSISKLSITPNPSSGKFKITIDSAIGLKTFNLVVRNTIGQIIVKNEFSGYEYNIDLGDKKNGIYFLEVFNAEQNFNKILIKN